jgi:hypothetical protein
MLARHVKLLLKQELGINFRFEKAPQRVTSDLSSIESLGSYHRWLRGVLCYLTLAVFAMSLASLEGSQKNVVDWAIFVASFPAQIILIRVYQVKYQLAGLTDAIYRVNPNLVNSPYFYQMLLEMCLWMAQCPPYVVQRFPMLEMLNFMPFCRLYTVAIYLNNSSFAYRPFCRAMAAMCGTPLTLSLYIRSALLYKSLKSSLILSGSLWVTLALMYSKAEGINFNDSVWFVFVTVGTIGYGDISPKTVQGRIIAFLSWIYALVLIGYVVVLTHGTLKLKEGERNMFILFRSNVMKAKLRENSAMTIQRCWRLYAAKRSGSYLFTKSHLAYLLLTQLNRMRHVRRTLRHASKMFHSQMADDSQVVTQVNSALGPKRRAAAADVREPGALSSPATPSSPSAQAFQTTENIKQRHVEGDDAESGGQMKPMAPQSAKEPQSTRQTLESLQMRMDLMEVAAQKILAALQSQVANRHRPAPVRSGAERCDSSPAKAHETRSPGAPQLDPSPELHGHSGAVSPPPQNPAAPGNTPLTEDSRIHDEVPLLDAGRDGSTLEGGSASEARILYGEF